MKYEERAFAFCCEETWLYGIASMPEQPAQRGMLIAVGGPQYRVGSHRQFTLLARQLAAAGIPVLRFDYRGMGDSEGDARTFEEVQTDLRCAVDKFFAEASFLREVVILGLCDAASAALFYAYQDSRVTGLVLLNPWIRTEEGSAKAYLQHYYAARLFQPELWRKIWRGDFNFLGAVRSLSQTIRAASPLRKNRGAAPTGTAGDSSGATFLPERMFYGFDHFAGRVLLILSGNDLTAREFQGLVEGSPSWQKLLAAPRVSRRDLPEASHTFSRREWRDQIGEWTTEWMHSW